MMYLYTSMRSVIVIELYVVYSIRPMELGEQRRKEK